MPGQLNDECELTEGGNRVSSFGHRSADGKHCEVQRRVNVRKGGKVVRTEIKTERVAIGRTLYRDPETGFVCTQARARDRRDCPLAVSPEQNRPMTNAEQFGYGGAKELVNRVTGAAHAVQAGAEVLSDPAKLSTRAEHTREKAGHLAEQTLQAVRDPHKAKEAAADFIADTAKGAHQKLIDFKELPRGKQIEVAGGVILNGALDLTAGAVVGGVLSTGEKAVETVDDARKLGKAATRGNKAANLANETTKVSDGPSFIVTPRGTVVPTSQSRMRDSFDRAGFPHKPTIKDEPGKIYTVPTKHGAVDVRTMEGSHKHPRRAVFSREGTNDPVRFDGEKFKGNMPQAQRRAESHLTQDE